MVKKNGKHRLVGFVDLGDLHDDMQTLSGIFDMIKISLIIF